MELQLTFTNGSMKRDGNLYRVDLRLRPFGSKGLTATSIDSFLEYMAETAEIWEMLAFVKLRFVGGDPSLGYTIENETRRFIHQRALSIEPAELRDETRRVRLALEQQRAGTRRGNEVDIKYGSGGMLDVYFAMRYLQLRDNIPDDQENRSTLFMLNRLKEKNSLTAQLLADLSCGYEFLSTLDHNLRLTVGRSTRIPFANADALATITARMRLSSTDELLERLTFHRLAIRGAFNKILP